MRFTYLLTKYTAIRNQHKTYNKTISSISICFSISNINIKLSSRILFWLLSYSRFLRQLLVKRYCRYNLFYGNLFIQSWWVRIILIVFIVILAIVLVEKIFVFTAVSPRYTPWIIFPFNVYSDLLRWHFLIHFSKTFFFSLILVTHFMVNGYFPRMSSPRGHFLLLLLTSSLLLFKADGLEIIVFF
jgi:hypothetical protein